MFEPPEADEFSCPNCGEVIKKKAILCRFCQLGLSTEHFRRCNDCAEMVRIESKICRFCKAVLEQRPAPAAKSLAEARAAMHSYGSGVRSQVFEVIVRQAMAGAPWRQICAGPMQVNNIHPDEIETEVNRRRGIQPQKVTLGKTTKVPLADRLQPIVSLIVDYARHNRRWKRICFPILLALNIPDSLIDQSLDDRPTQEFSKASLTKLVMLLVAEIAKTNDGWRSFCLPLMDHHAVTNEEIEQIVARSKQASERPPVFGVEISDDEIDVVFRKMGIPPQEPDQLAARRRPVLPDEPDEEPTEPQSRNEHAEVFPLVLKDLCSGNDPFDVLNKAARRLVDMLDAERIVVWRAGSILKVLTESSSDHKNLYSGVQLPESESTAVMLELVAAGAKNLDVITWKEPFADIPLLKSTSHLYSMISFGTTSHILLLPLIADGATKGLVMIYLSTRLTSSKVSDMKRTCDLMAICMEKMELAHIAAKDDELLTLFKFIATRFKTKTVFTELRSVSESLGAFLGFVECSLYSVEGSDLVSVDGKDIIPIDEKTKDPIVTSLLEGKPKVIPPFGTKLFGFDIALVLPLIKRSKKIGVVIFWKLSGTAEIRPKELEIAATFADFLAALVETTDDGSADGSEHESS